jgi:hypothetical protein
MNSASMSRVGPRGHPGRSRIWLKTARWPVIAGVAVVGLALFFAIGIGAQAGLEDKSLVVRDFVPRSRWILSSVALWASLLVTCLYCTGVLVQSGRPGLRRRAMVCCGAAFLVTLAYSIYDSQRGFVIGWEIMPLVPTTIPLAWYFHFLNASASIGMALLVLGFSETVLIARAHFGLPARVASALTSQRVMLLLASTVLVIGAVEIYFLSRWQSIHAPWGSPVAELSAGIAVTLGVGFSLFLMALYVPAAFATHLIARRMVERALRKANRSISPKAINKAMRLNGLSTSLAATVQVALGVIGPTAAAIVGTILEQGIGAASRR